MKWKPRMHVTDVYLDPDPQLGIGVQMWSAKRKFRFGFPNASSG